VTLFENNMKSGVSVVFGKKPLKALLVKEGLRAIVIAGQQK